MFETLKRLLAASRGIQRLVQQFGKTAAIHAPNAFNNAERWADDDEKEFSEYGADLVPRIQQAPYPVLDVAFTETVRPDDFSFNSSSLNEFQRRDLMESQDWISFDVEPSVERSLESELEIDGLIERRLMEILSRNPDVLGTLIQRERGRGNPLFL